MYSNLRWHDWFIQSCHHDANTHVPVTSIIPWYGFFLGGAREAQMCYDLGKVDFVGVWAWDWPAAMIAIVSAIRSNSTTD